MQTRVAVITDIHGNLPALQAALARIDELGIEASTAAATSSATAPPNEVCALIAGARRSRRSTATTTTRSRRDLDDCGCAYITPHDRELGQQSVDWTLEHTDQRSKDFMRELPFDLHFAVGEQRHPPGARLAAQGQRVPLRGQAGAPVRAPRAGEKDDVLVFGHTHKPWVHEYGGVLFVNCGSVGKPKDGDPRGAFAILRASRGVDVTIERVEYDARAVAREVAAAGLPAEFAEKLLVAAHERRLALARGCWPSSSASAFLAAVGDRLGHRRPAALAGRHRAAAARERGRHRGRPVRDHPDVRAGLGRRTSTRSSRSSTPRFGGLRWRDALAYIPAQVAGCIAGAIVANVMFALAAISISTHHRATPAHLFAEVIATLG